MAKGAEASRGAATGGRGLSVCCTSTELVEIIMNTTACTVPMILAIDFGGRIYVLEDEQGKIIGAGTRKACEVLLSLITNKLAIPVQKAEPRTPSQTQTDDPSTLSLQPAAVSIRRRG